MKTLDCQPFISQDEIMLQWLGIIVLALIGALFMGWIYDRWRHVPGWDEPKDPAWGLKHRPPKNQK